MLKVAHVTTLYYGGRDGLETKLVGLDSYDDIQVTALTSPQDETIECPPSRVRQLRYPIARSIKPLADLKSIAVLYRIFRRERFDIVHTHSAKPGMVGAIAARLAKVPLVFHTSHGLPFYDGQRWWDYRKYHFLETLACKFRDHYFSQNKRDIAACIKMMGSADKVSYEGNGVDVDTIRRIAKDDLARAEADFPAGALRIAMIGRLEPVKRCSDFLKVCKLLVQNEVQIGAIIAGCGPLESELNQEVKQLSLAGRVRMLGWKSYAPSLIAASDVVVLTSEKEGIPRTLMEAQALGKPVVATDVLGTQELVENKKTGFLVPLGDIHAMAEKISILGKDPELRRRLGEAGKVRVEEHFNDTKIAAFLRDFYLKAYARRLWENNKNDALLGENND